MCRGHERVAAARLTAAARGRAVRSPSGQRRLRRVSVSRRARRRPPAPPRTAAASTRKRLTEGPRALSGRRSGAASPGFPETSGKGAGFLPGANGRAAGALQSCQLPMKPETRAASEGWPWEARSSPSSRIFTHPCTHSRSFRLLGLLLARRPGLARARGWERGAPAWRRRPRTRARTGPRSGLRERGVGGGGGKEKKLLRAVKLKQAVTVSEFVLRSHRVYGRAYCPCLRKVGGPGRGQLWSSGG